MIHVSMIVQNVQLSFGVMPLHKDWSALHTYQYTGMPMHMYIQGLMSTSRAPNCLDTISYMNSYMANL